MADRKRKIDEELNTPEPEVLETPKSTHNSSLEDELWQDILMEDGAEKKPLVLDPVVVPAAPAKAAKSRKITLKRRDVLLIVIAIIAITGIVLGVTLPSALEARVSNFAQTTLMEGNLSMDIQSTGVLDFYVSLPITAGFMPHIFDFKTEVDEDGKSTNKASYQVLAVNISNNTNLYDLIQTEPDTVLLDVIRLSGSSNPFGDDTDVGIGARRQIKASDIIETINENNPEEMEALEFYLAKSFISVVNVKEGDTITSASKVLFVATDYSKARVAIALTQDTVYKLILAEEATGGELSATVSFSAPRGNISGTLQKLSRTPSNISTSTGAVTFTAFVYINDIPSPDSGSAVNSSNIMGGTATVKIRTGEMSGIIAPTLTIYNDGTNDYVLMKKSENSNATERVYVRRLLSSGNYSIIESDDPRVQNGASIYYVKEDSLLSSLL